ncbi:FAD-binding oxidoreductase [Actinomadura verrucosospora]|uniref:FAD linked oxidase domain-containing protein n=1 Tax=Actinomadura verrucosospora TaxID=46165 RepID=A0A7D3W1S0_ACTVE|nr:FAD-binding oxidoreductase [Actinomadura verrucosospora]QKG27078.1 FAD linked oxidase domain-containing protein [Actinomadura verrucosospora]
MPWAAGVRQPVIAVVEAADAAEVADLVRYAANAGLTISVQPSGHGASGDVAGVILLRTGRMNRVEVDPARRTARVEAGARWDGVLAEAAGHGLTGPSGSSAAVSVAGFVAGGGLSRFSRGHGWAADSVRALEVVGADGRAARVTADTDAELFWALRGGGGDFAVITAIELDLLPIPHLHGERTLWPAARTGEVLRAFRQITATAPRELSLWVTRSRTTVAVEVTHLGGAGDARDLLAPLERLGGALSGDRAPRDLAGPADAVVRAGRSPFRAELLTHLDDQVLDLLASAPPPLHLRHLAGALAEADPARGAGGILTEPYLLVTGPALPDGLAPHVSGRKPYTFLAPGESAAHAFPPSPLARLRRIKDARDPHRVLRANFPVHQ